MNKEIKEQWLKALRSGEFRQGFSRLVIQPTDYLCVSGKTEHCCIGVLGEIIEELDNSYGDMDKSPYNFLEVAIGTSKMKNLILINDKGNPRYWGMEDYPCDYSNVIPIIENLEVQE